MCYVRYNVRYACVREEPGDRNPSPGECSGLRPRSPMGSTNFGGDLVGESKVPLSIDLGHVGPGVAQRNLGTLKTVPRPNLSSPGVAELEWRPTVFLPPCLQF